MVSEVDKSNHKISENERAELARKLDEDLDQFMDCLATRKKDEPKRPFDFDEWCKDLDQHPAFMKELKPNEKGEYSEAVQALQQLKYDDGSSIEERIESANNHKEEGNKYFKLKKYRWATDCYTNGIKVRCTDRKLNSVLHANRAAAQKRLLNIRSALRDCIFSRKHDPHNYKAILRGTDCLLELGYGQRCLDWIESSLAQINSPAAESVIDESEEKHKAFLSRLAELKDSAKKSKLIEDKNARRDKLALAKDLAAKKKLLQAIAERKLRFKPSLFMNPSLFEWSQIEVRLPQVQSHQKVYLTEEGFLQWPLLIQYPEFGQVDFLTDCCENNELGDILNPIFEQTAEWDHSQLIRKDNVRYFLSLDVYDDDEVYEIFLSETLKTVLSTANFAIKQGLPVVQVYTKKQASEFFSAVSERVFKVL